MVRTVSFVAAALMALALAPALGRTTPGQSGPDGSLIVSAKTAAVRDSRSRPISQDEASVKAAASDNARLSEYIEMHGRATDDTGRASLMPWSALKQMAN